ncbi:MAG: SigE family RNA polymerase sigma factor [Actinomycetota bacterium]
MRETLTADAATSPGLETLYLHHAPSALRFAYFLTGDQDAARDLVQDAFVRVAGRFRYLRQPSGFDAYLRRTIVNLNASRLRRLKVERSSLAREAAYPVVADPEHDPGASDELWQAILDLPPRQRAAVVLRYYEDLSEPQAADILRCSVKALNQLVVRAMKTLRTRLGEDG